ncbi:MAG: cyclase family protein [Chitinophagales bacterium]|mgnify:FL=1|nr:cyclase family protein [Chitinophagales bacterium]
MQTHIQLSQHTYTINLSQPLNIAIPLKAGMETVNCFYAPPLDISPVRMGDFVGDVTQGGVVNFKNVQLNPHGNGTHTECVGHIAPVPYTINQCLTEFFVLAQLISLYPQKMENGDRLITLSQLQEHWQNNNDCKAIVIRTLPNDEWKLRTHYSGSNPPYLSAEAAQFLVDKGIEHLLIDLPSVDREIDGGMLAAHHIFWQYPHDIRLGASISELIYVPNDLQDGWYFVNLMICSLELDAAPSKPILYKVESIH